MNFETENFEKLWGGEGMFDILNLQNQEDRKQENLQKSLLKSLEFILNLLKIIKLQ